MTRPYRTPGFRSTDFSLSVVIPTVGKSPHLRGLLERLQRQVTDFKFEILVVANLPQQALRNLVSSMGAQGNGKFEYLETGRLGVNLARNKGLERSRAAIVLFLDDDAILDSDTFLSAHETHHRRLPAAVAIGGPYRLTGTSSLWDRAYHDIAHEWLSRHRTSQNGTTQLLGGNLSVKRSELEKNRWIFDEEISFGGAETGLCQRIANADREMYFFAELEIGHAPNLSKAILRKKAYSQGAGARWRNANIAGSNLRLTSEFLTPTKAENPAHRRARALYRTCFEFGWRNAPFDDRTRTSPPTFNYFTYFLFLVFRRRPFKALRRWHREMYTTVRTAWINGERSRRTSIP